ncbi:putative nadh flavin oxidoreductase nadh oxidase [Lyophyllum shimeji]|uniref:Nadh flavin oxidoreductase nadh oxidase n=1 Tax=Lyophyllum shimeji TaxID=47721 RepID=A0A9P3UUY2_LYOSH|nr:putative nadh flavin oxidoreductase nadh oxidase [Lyophyllum shimeji]
MPAAVISKLFQPTEVGRVSLSHRVVLAPLTRFCNAKTGHVPVLPLSKGYYTQRVKVPGSLLITESTVIAPQAGGYYNVPGIWGDEQVDAWKQITDAVHAAGSSIFMQLCGLGRAADPSVLAANNPPLPVIGPSNIPLTGCATPCPLTIDEIHEYAELFARAGFDGVELHGQWYGGSVENRSRFVLEAVDAVARAVGPERTALRLSPWNRFQDMGMKDPVPQYTHLVTALCEAHPSLAYLHVVEPRISGDNDRESAVHESNDFIRAIWQDRPYITAGGYTAQTAMAAAERGSEFVAFGRHYISNPDLPLKLKRNMPLTPYNRTTFYVPGEHDDAHVGYIDYPFTEETV